jgi:hypothetical protein
LSSRRASEIGIPDRMICWRSAAARQMSTDAARTAWPFAVTAHPSPVRSSRVAGDGKPIFYGLGHFVFDLPGLEAALTPLELAKLQAMGEFAIDPREGYPLSPFHPDARMTMIAICCYDGAVLVVPCLIDGANHAVPVHAGSAQGQAVLRYMDEISRVAGLATRYRRERWVGGYELIAAEG